VIKGHKIIFEYAAYDEKETPPQVLKEIDISINTGEFIAILGHNGSGKSTLARHFNALLTPTSGTLWVTDKDTKDSKNVWAIRQSVGMLFQNPDNQIIASVVEEDVAFGPENLGVPPKEIRTRVDEALSVVGMSEYASSPPHYLSGGQKQRVTIAGVLAMSPSCLVLDEPTAMLDPSGRKEVLDTIMRLNKEMGITVILITHFMEEATLANRVLVMESGKVILDNTPCNIFSNVKQMEDLGLGAPQITLLNHRLKTYNLPVKDTVLSVEDFLQNHELIDKLINYHSADNTQESKILPAPIIHLQNLTYIYNPNSIFEKIALNSINMQIYSGEIVAIIGHTGSGKSTLIQHLNALLMPTSGHVLVNGEDIFADKSKLASARQEVGLVFQYPEHQLFEATVYKDVAFGPLRMNLSKAEVDERVCTSLNAVGIDSSFYEKSPFELSGGQKRRIAIAGVLAMRPKVLVLDEPTAGLDPGGKNEILAQIKHMHMTLGITVILVSHSMEDVAQLADRIFVMNKGEIICKGTPQQIFSKGKLLKEIGLDTPYVSKLFEQLNKKNPHIPTGIFTIDDAIETIIKMYKGKNV